MLNERSTELELMDDLTLTGEALRQNLRELEFINQYLGGHDVVRNGLDKIYKKAFSGSKPETALKIADLGSGGGDTLRMVAQWARRRNIPVQLVGYDANAFMVEYGTRHSQHFPEISFRQADVYSAAFAQEEFDIVICSLFLHHFPDQALVTLFNQLHRQATTAVLVNDLHRHPLAYYSIKALTAVFSKSHLVKHDAPLSVKRAFVRQDWRNLLTSAGVATYTLQWRWAFRWQLIF
ncbi:methyltransferase domain-containing protein [Rufibacter sp. LB8]|uniref:methyltransferase domain-containing protein n=1 Tax=Rufibacter sp. LB8 TaxID=2777781 RepID=UPI001CEF9A47|nr:methyltransferase domain-containing protein [Rufibacter sp. LB8]